MSTPPPPSPLRVLLVDDDPDNLRLSLRQLKKLNHIADAAEGAQQALDLLAKNAYDVVLMDCNMPGMDGYACCREIRRREGTAKHTTVIAMTAALVEDAKEKCLAAGMDDCITKAGNVETLRAALDKWRPGTRS